jgi:hypothetical protein
VDLGAGGMTPLRSEHRRAYGTSPGFSGGVSSRFGAGSGRAFLEVAYVAASGSEVPRDPTFEAEELTYRLVPVSVGLRGELGEPSPDASFHVLVGAGWQTVFSWRDTPDDDGRSSPTIGGFVEIQPEVRIDARWCVWLRQRLAFLADTTYDDPLASINYSGSLLQLGVGLALDRDVRSSRGGPQGDS